MLNNSFCKYLLKICHGRTDLLLLSLCFWCQLEGVMTITPLPADVHQSSRYWRQWLTLLLTWLSTTDITSKRTKLSVLILTRFSTCWFLLATILSNLHWQMITWWNVSPLFTCQSRRVELPGTRWTWPGLAVGRTLRHPAPPAGLSCQQFLV